MFTTASKAKEYILMRFEYETELRSYMQEVTDNGVFMKEHLEQMNDKTLIDIAEDLHWQFEQEFAFEIQALKETAEQMKKTESRD